MAVLSRAAQTESYIRKAILRGRWNPGERLPLENELAVELGVGRVTVREAMAPLVREGILSRKPGVGTYVSDNVSTGSIVVLGSLNNAFSQTGAYERMLIQQIYDLLQNTPYNSKLAIGSGESIDEFTSSLHLFDGPDLRDTLGLISTAHWLPIEDMLNQSSVKHVTIGPFSDREGHALQVDLSYMFDEATRVLRERGQSDFAVMYMDYSSQVATEGSRAAEKTDMISQEVLTAVDGCEDRLVPVSYADAGRGLVYPAFVKWWSSPQRKGSLFISDSALVPGVMEAIEDMRIRVPDDLAILAQTMAEENVAGEMNLARLEFSIREIAGTALDMVLDLIEGREIRVTNRSVRPRYIPGNSLMS